MDSVTNDRRPHKIDAVARKESLRSARPTDHTPFYRRGCCPNRKKGGQLARARNGRLFGHRLSPWMSSGLSVFIYFYFTKRCRVDWARLFEPACSTQMRHPAVQSQDPQAQSAQMTTFLPPSAFHLLRPPNPLGWRFLTLPC